MIDGDIKNACENSKMICIGLRNDPADDYLVGYVECCDEEGIIFCNVDSNGFCCNQVITNGHNRTTIS